jgi:hypothetical protein
MLRIIYDVVYDSLATVDVSGGVLLAAIWVQTGYVALFRVMHGDDAGRATAPAAAPARATHAALPRGPWGAG